MGGSLSTYRDSKVDLPAIRDDYFAHVLTVPHVTECRRDVIEREYCNGKYWFDMPFIEKSKDLLQQSGTVSQF